MIATRRSLLRMSSALSATALLARYPGARLVQAQAATYDVIDLGVLADTVEDKNGSESYPTINDVNDDGLVVGKVVASKSKFSPATWSDAGKLRRIKSGKFGGEINAVNAAGVLAGAEFLAAAGKRRPVLWRDGEKIDLPYPSDVAPEFEGAVYGINDDDVAVGWTFYNHDNSDPDSPPSTLPIALRWIDEKVEVLPRPDDARSSSAYCINAAGVIGGSVSFEERQELSLWTDGELEFVPLPESIKKVSSFSVRQITANGLMLASGFADEKPQSFIYDRGKPSAFSGLNEDDFVFARDVNDDGVVVGLSYPAGQNLLSRATIWLDGEASDLNTVIPSASGLTLKYAVAISNSGAIACVGEDEQEQSHGALLLPKA